MTLVDGEVHLHNQIHVVELEFKIGVDLINLVSIGEIGVGINRYHIFGMTIGVGDKEALFTYMKMVGEIPLEKNQFILLLVLVIQIINKYLFGVLWEEKRGILF